MCGALSLRIAAPSSAVRLIATGAAPLWLTFSSSSSSRRPTGIRAAERSVNVGSPVSGSVASRSTYRDEGGTISRIAIPFINPSGMRRGDSATLVSLHLVWRPAVPKHRGRLGDCRPAEVHVPAERCPEAVALPRVAALAEETAVQI